jgi:glutamate-1-semialdehyde 2,1-aminomutase
MHRDLLNAGIYLPPSGYEVLFISAAHTEDSLGEAAGVIAQNLLKRL